MAHGVGEGGEVVGQLTAKLDLEGQALPTLLAPRQAEVEEVILLQGRGLQVVGVDPRGREVLLRCRRTRARPRSRGGGRRGRVFEDEAGGLVVVVVVSVVMVVDVAVVMVIVVIVAVAVVAVTVVEVVVEVVARRVDCW